MLKGSRSVKQSQTSLTTFQCSNGAKDFLAATSRPLTARLLSICLLGCARIHAALVSVDPAGHVFDRLQDCEQVLFKRRIIQRLSVLGQQLSVAADYPQLV